VHVLLTFQHRGNFADTTGGRQHSADLAATLCHINIKQSRATNAVWRDRAPTSAQQLLVVVWYTSLAVNLFISLLICRRLHGRVHGCSAWMRVTTAHADTIRGPPPSKLLCQLVTPDVGDARYMVFPIST